MSNITEDDGWKCGMPGCELDIDGHNFGLAIAHIFDMSEEEGQQISDRILAKAERQLLG